MRRKKLWNKTVAAVLGLALVMGAPLVDLGNGRLLGGVEITAQAAFKANWVSGALTNSRYELVLSGTVTADEIRNAINNNGFGDDNIRANNIISIKCAADTKIVGSLVGTGSNGNEGMFKNFTALQSVDFTNATFEHTGDVSVSYLFANCSSLKTINWGSFDMEGVTQARYMFYGCSSLTSLDLSTFDTSSLQEVNSMFEGCSSLQSVDVSTWDASHFTSVANMFKGCSSLQEIDLSSWDTSSVTNMNSTFNGCSALTTVKASEKWSKASVTTADNMFLGCTNIRGENGTTYTYSNVGGVISGVSSAYAVFDKPGVKPGYLTYKGDLVKRVEVSATFTQDGTEEYWTDPTDSTNILQIASNGLFTQVTDFDSEVVIPKILTTHYDEVPATPNSAGTKEYWDGKDGMKYLWSDDENTYVSALAEDLIINPTPVSLVDAVAATYTETGHTAYYTDGNGHYYEKDANDQYVEHPLEYFTTPALLGTHHDAATVSPYEDGNEEYWESANEGKCYVSDGNGGYTEVDLEDVLHPAVGVEEVVSRKEPSYGQNGAGNISYVIGGDGNKYVLNEGTGKFELVENEADLVIPALKLAMRVDPVNTQSAVDILICAEMPADANVNEYSLQFGTQVVPFSSSYSWTDSTDNTVYYLAKISSPAKDMATEYPFSIKKQDEVTYTGLQAISVRTYALTVINGTYDGDYTAEQKTALSNSCRAMLAYGSAAQTYKQYNTSHLADAGVSGVGSSYADVALPTVEVFAKEQLNEALTAAEAPIRYNGMGLEMLADTHINLAFRVQKGYTQEQAIAYISENIQIDGVAAVATPNTNVNYVIVQTNALPIKNLFHEFTLNFENEDYAVSVEQYMSAANDQSEVLKNLCKALLNYYNFATAINN